jgi:hypothetical protein
MKKIKIYLSAFTALATFQTALAQDIQLNINTSVPSTIPVGGTTNILVDVCNVDANPTTAAANLIRTVIYTSSQVSITGVSDTSGNPLTNWTIISQGADSILLQLNDILPNFECTSFHVNLQGIAVGNGSFPGHLRWNGAPPLEDLDANNHSTTGIVVTAPLPVSLTAFTAEKQGSTSLLNWNTASEVNNAGFDIERGADGRSFSKIGIVYSKANNGNSNAKLAYSYIDASPLAGTNYYRLRQVDRDGKSAYSKIEQVTFGTTTGVQVYPNPTTGILTVSLSDDYAQAEIKLYTTLGRAIELPGTGKGSHLRTLNLSGLAQGQYVLRVVNGTNTQTFKVTYQP